MRLLEIPSNSGLTKQMSSLLCILSNEFQHHYILAKGDKRLEKAFVYSEGIFHTRKFRDCGYSVFQIFYNVFWLFIHKVRITRIFECNTPISAEPSIAALFSMIVKIFCKKVIFIEHVPRVAKADLFFVQRANLKKSFPKVICAKGFL